ncbi:MAG: glycine cleavage system protein GcvH [Thermodesulfobacteriaceae bacterium]|nr:glycine cleavage system protein GcvH [Thermodesulfobacteriaceae bacterium]
MKILEDRLYTEKHLWVKKEKKKIVKVGITDFYKSKDIEIIEVDLPEEGEEYEKEDIFGSLESIEEVYDLYMPVSGMIVAVNEKVLDEVDILNEDPYEEGWLVKIELTNAQELEELLPPEDYEIKASEELEEILPESAEEVES